MADELSGNGYVSLYFYCAPPRAWLSPSEQLRALIGRCEHETDKQMRTNAVSSQAVHHGFQSRGG